MKFATRQDCELPAEDLFAAISDFPLAERMLVNHGTPLLSQGRPLFGTEPVRPLFGPGSEAPPVPEPGAGMAWQIGFDLRDKRRDVRLSVVRFDRPENIVMEGVSDMFDLTIEMTVIALTRAKSRLIFEVDARPRNMRARLLLQTAKLGKSQLDRQFASRIADYVAGISSAHRPRQAR